MVLDVSNVAMSFGANTVLSDISFQVHEKERVSVVGYNGCGKTTLLSIITGELTATGGFVVLKNKATIGYQKQMSSLNGENTVYTEMKSVNNADRILADMKRLEATMGNDERLIEEYEKVSAEYDAIDGYNLDFNIKKILNGMGFPKETHEKRVGVLSGGEKTRLSLAKLLIMKPDLLILDEPTNHLDIETLEWLEQFLMSYDGAVLQVSHDRHYLDAVTTKTVEIANGKSKTYNGNFSAYLHQKEENDLREEREYAKRMETAEKLSDYVQKNLVRASTSNMAKSRRKQLEKLDLSEPETDNHVKVKLEILPDNEPYKEVLTIKDFTVKAGGRELVSNLDVELLRGERLAIVGSNGTGKTTLLKAILGKTPPASGRARLGGGVKISYLEQHLSATRSKNPMEFIWDIYPAMNQLEVRNLLATVGFRGDDVFTDSRGLSGGELARLNLAKISLEHPNLLILDEPTNHLDIYTKDILYEALRTYTGTMIVVTHDRYLMECTDSRILLLGDDGWKLFESYAKFREFRENGNTEPAPKPETKKEEKREEPAVNQKELRARRAKERERRAFLEKRIEELEILIYDTEQEINSPEVASDHTRLSELCDILEDSKGELNDLSDEWLENYSED